jgi:hypothetical protein
VVKTANIRLTRNIDAEGQAWHSLVLDVGKEHLEPPVAFRTLGGVTTYLADILCECFDVHGTRETQPALEPVVLVEVCDE